MNGKSFPYISQNRLSSSRCRHRYCKILTIWQRLLANIEYLSATFSTETGNCLGARSLANSRVVTAPCAVESVLLTEIYYHRPCLFPQLCVFFFTTVSLYYPISHAFRSLLCACIFSVFQRVHKADSFRISVAGFCPLRQVKGWPEGWTKPNEGKATDRERQEASVLRLALLCLPCDARNVSCKCPDSSPSQIRDSSFRVERGGGGVNGVPPTISLRFPAAVTSFNRIKLVVAIEVATRTFAISLKISYIFQYSKLPNVRYATSHFLYSSCSHSSSNRLFPYPTLHTLRRGLSDAAARLVVKSRRVSVNPTRSRAILVVLSVQRRHSYCTFLFCTALPSVVHAKSPRGNECYGYVSCKRY